jgi:hypothetical protein
MVTDPFDRESFPFDPPTPPGREAPPPDPPDPPRAAENAAEDEEWERVREERRRRKERVLHTRVSEKLSEDIRRAAEDLRVPVSNLVRNVLEEAFGAVERVSDEVGEFLEDFLGDTEGARRDIRRLRHRVRHLARRQRSRLWREPESDAAPEAEDDAAFAQAEGAPAGGRSFPEILGWQPLLLNAPAPCAGCDRPLERGARVFVGATEKGLSRTFLCEPCMRARGGA